MENLAENRRARFDYEILDTYVAGIELLGSEVKSARAGQINLGASYAIIRNKEAWLIGTKISAYQPKNSPEGYDSERTRKLLLQKAEIRTLTGKLQEKGLSLIPLRAFLKQGLIKIELGLGKSKKLADKRETIKRREQERDMRRATSR